MPRKTIAHRNAEFAAVDKLSDLLEMALDDMAVIRKDPRYVLDMGRYHEPAVDGCHVCMAGCVLANRLGLDPEEYYYSRAGSETGARMRAIDHMRAGAFGMAAVSLGGEPPLDAPELLRVYDEYRASGSRWRASVAAYRAAVRYLRSVGS